MAAAMSGEFPMWLSSTLQEINPDIDLEVFVSYIQGVLEDEEDDREESISGFLAEVMEADEIEPMCNKIIQQWQDNQSVEEDPDKESKSLDEKLAHLMEHHKVTDIKVKVLSAEEKARKEAILAQYSQVSDEEDEDTGSHEQSTPSGGGELMGFKNTNADAVNKSEQEKREKMKDASDKKKERDKQEREKQKQKKDDRKEAEKKRTQKGEKRR